MNLSDTQKKESRITHNQSLKLIEDKIEKINKEVDIFQQKLGRAPSYFSSELFSICDELKIKHLKLQNELESFKEASGSAYHELQAGFEMAWEDFRVSYDSAKTQFEKEQNQ